MSFLMRGMRGQLWAHDEHHAEGMHFLNNVTDGVVFITMTDDTEYFCRHQNTLRNR